MDVTDEDPDKNLGSSRTAVSYVRFIESGGARVVPIRGGESDSYYAQMAKWTNGVFFPGGYAYMENTPTGLAARRMFEHAIRLNQQGEYYPVLGICWGLQMLSHLIAGENNMSKTDSRNATWSLDFTPEFRDSRLFGSAPEDIIDILSTQKVAQHHHNYSVTTETYHNTNLGKFFKLLSTNKDRDGVEFVSTLESRDYPIYALQWHPEKPLFLWDPEQHIVRSDGAITVGQYIAKFIVDEARKSSHRFPSMEKEGDHVIWNNTYIFKSNPEEYFLEFYYMNREL